MDLTALFRRGPYTAFPRSFSPLPHPGLTRATWQIVASPAGLPAVQLNLAFSPQISLVTANPEMTVALLLDRSGSMSGVYSDGHVYNLAGMLLDRLKAANVGYDLIFYNTNPSYAGHIDNYKALQQAIDTHPAGGGTAVVEALRGAVTRYRKKRGIYIIVVTDGEFNDKVQAKNVVVNEFLPQLTPANPFAFRLHFVGAGTEVDREFLEELERAASSQGMAMVAGHHHAHLSHAHLTIQNELERTFLGAGTDVEFKRTDVSDADSHHIARVGQQALQNFHAGDDDRFSFLPLQSTWLIEVAATTASHLQLEVTFESRQGPQRMALSIPFVAPQAKQKGWRVHWPWESPGDAAQRRERDAHDAAEHEASLERQREDLKALARGGIPATARQRLEELRDDPNALFTCNLDPSEAALLRRVGYRPVATVSGSAMYHVGQAFASTTDCEVSVLSHAYDEATRLAVGRLEEELKVVGAHGVIGVRFTMARHEWGDKTIEVQIVGTAVEGPDKQRGEPFLCDLSGHEWWALRRAGYEPAELVWGHCSWFVFTDAYDEQMVRSGVNGELTHWGTALQTARTRALQRARDMAAAEHAQGIVGVRFERRVSEVRLAVWEAEIAAREHHDLLVTILGTAIRLRKDAPRAVQATTDMLSLRDGRLTPIGLLRETDASFE